jgi:hypothetical protein
LGDLKKLAVFRDTFGVHPHCADWASVNKPVHKFTLLDEIFLIRYRQFIERAEMGGDGQQTGAKDLKDNPR